MNELVKTESSNMDIEYVDKHATVPDVVNNIVGIFGDLPKEFQMVTFGGVLFSAVGLTALAIIRGNGINIGDVKIAPNFVLGK